MVFNLFIYICTSFYFIVFFATQALNSIVKLFLNLTQAYLFIVVYILRTTKTAKIYIFFCCIGV